MLPGDGAHRTSATLWLVEGDHPLRAIRYDDGFAGTDWSEIVLNAARMPCGVASTPMPFMSDNIAVLLIGLLAPLVKTWSTGSD